MTNHFQPHDYQRLAIEFLLDRLFVHEAKGAGLFLDPGLGKTSVTLSTLQTIRRFDDLQGALIVAPLRVVYSVWPQEIAKWGFDFTTSIIHGTPTQRLKALNAKADIHLTNPENLVWLQRQQHKPWDTLVIDESTKFKNWTAKRTRALRKMLDQFKRRLILTGTPSPNSLGDLFAQVFLLDDGEALGKTATVFRSRFMRRGGFQGREWQFIEGRQTDLEAAIHPLVLRQSAADHLDLPPIVYNRLWCELPPKIHRDYRRLERELFLALDAGETLTANNAGAKYAMCRSLANGGAYEDREGQRITHHLHNAKTDALREVVGELGGKPVLVAYQFIHDLERLREAYPGAPSIGGHTKAKEDAQIIDDWNAGKIHVLLVQPQSMSHGVNLQAAGNDIVWFGVSERLEDYLQFNARLYRQGVTGQVRIHHILARNTIDAAMIDRLTEKDQRQTQLLEALKRYGDEKYGENRQRTGRVETQKTMGAVA